MSQAAHKSPADAPAEPALEELYERYIKPLSPRDRLRLVEMIVHELSHDLSRESTSKESTPREPEQMRNLLDLEGLGAEIWEGIDAQEYVNELRKEWDHRP